MSKRTEQKLSQPTDQNDTGTVSIKLQKRYSFFNQYAEDTIFLMWLIKEPGTNFLNFYATSCQE